MAIGNAIVTFLNYLIATLELAAAVEAESLCSENAVLHCGSATAGSAFGILQNNVFGKSLQRKTRSLPKKNPPHKETDFMNQ